MKQEILRKAIHISVNSLIPLIYLIFNIPKEWMIGTLAVLTILIVAVDLGRTRYKWLSYIFTKLFNSMLRLHELDNKLTGASYVFIGSLLAIMIFPREIAVLALLFTAIGDTAAALFGRKFGRHKIWNKSLEGTFAGLFACVIVTLFFPQIPNVMKLSGAAAAMLIELLPIKIDDNLRIPLFSGFVMYILSIII